MAGPGWKGAVAGRAECARAMRNGVLRAGLGGDQLVCQHRNAGHRHTRWVVRLAVVGQVLFLLLTWVGLIDAWVDFRKRFDRREPGTPDGISAVSGGDADEEETEWK